MKQAFAILFALTLVFGQPAVRATADCSSSAGACCGCGGKMQCCVAESGNPAPASPAVPAPNLAEKDSQAALWLVVQLIPSAPAVEPPGPAVSARCSAPDAVPLFARDCAYLL